MLITQTQNKDRDVILLNLGCNNYKLDGFTNIDLDPSVNPDICMDLMDLDKRFKPRSVRFIFAGHVLEHLEFEKSREIVKKCFNLLEPMGSFLSVVPDFTKCRDLPIEKQEGIILAGGEHKSLYNRERLLQVYQEAGFFCVAEFTDLNRIPYILVSDVNNPKPDPWQTAVIGTRLK